MANRPSSKKRIRQNAKRAARNRWRKGRVKSAVREFNDAVSSGETKGAAELLKTVYKTLDRTAAKGPMHKNTAARKKAQLARKLAAAGKEK